MSLASFTDWTPRAEPELAFSPSFVPPSMPQIWNVTEETPMSKVMEAGLRPRAIGRMSTVAEATPMPRPKAISNPTVPKLSDGGRLEIGDAGNWD
jgi:hypothetical protein